MTTPEGTGTPTSPTLTPAGEGSPELLALLAEIAAKVPPACERFAEANDLAQLEEFRIEVLGKKGVLTEMNARMGALAPTEKPIAGKLLNNHKAQVIHAFNARKEALEGDALKTSLQAESVDVTLPGVRPRTGHLHPITQTTLEIVKIFQGMGFRVESGPEIENEWFNFEALNVPADHPARDMQDTFYTERDCVLRTHTSPTQLRSMMRIAPPMAVITTGRVFRCDSDATHSPMFHQMEGLYIDRKVSMAHLKGVLNEFIRAYYGPNIKTRFRPSFFPFTEPSGELDIQSDVVRGGWMEVLGCGMVHPTVLRNAGLDPAEWSGFAFGLGIDRLAMIKYGINDIRLLTENDMRFLGQF